MRFLLGLGEDGCEGHIADIGISVRSVYDICKACQLCGELCDLWLGSAAYTLAK